MKIKISYDELPCEVFKEDFPIKYRISGDYAEICFDKDAYTYCIVWKDEGIIESITNCKDYAIAGNIYEDKELLDEVEE